jgi:hypothetical protein
MTKSPIDQRRLAFYGATGTSNHEQYITWNPLATGSDGVGEDGDCEFQPNDLRILSGAGAGLFDVGSYHDDSSTSGMVVTKTCAAQDSWKFYTSTRCDSTNFNSQDLNSAFGVDAAALAFEAKMDSVSCRHCHGTADEVAAAVAAAAALGLTLDCRGLNEAVDGDSPNVLALCVDPSAGLALCTEGNVLTGATTCSGIEWSKSQPRVYLNKGACDDGGEIAASLIQPDDTYNFALVDQCRLSYELHGFATCNSKGDNTNSWNIGLEASNNGNWNDLKDVTTVTKAEDAIALCDLSPDCGAVGLHLTGNNAGEFVYYDKTFVYGTDCSDAALDETAEFSIWNRRTSTAYANSVTPDCVLTVTDDDGANVGFTRQASCTLGVEEKFGRNRFQNLRRVFRARFL